MPFGLRNDGATYQRLVDKTFHGQIGRNLEVYVDDLVIKSRTKDEVVRDIEETFKTLRKINMKLNPKKCTFGVEEGMFLGYQVNTKGIKICPDKVDVVLSLQSPKCLKDVQKLNGKLASLNSKKRRNITMAMISAFTTVDKMAHNSQCFFRHVQRYNFLVSWLSLEKAYAPHSTSREYTLRTKLLRIKMHGDETPDAYLNRAQEYADALAAIGEPSNYIIELHALLSDHDYMLGKTRAPAPSITLSFAANYAVGSPSMPEARQAQLSELTAQLSALGFQVSPITPSGPQAFYGARSNKNKNNNNNNNRSNNNNNLGNRNNSRGNNNRGRGNGRQFHWASTQNTIYGTAIDVILVTFHHNALIVTLLLFALGHPLTLQIPVLNPLMPLQIGTQTPEQTVM
ncbi:reverse transcriptase domain-containing protein [Tanacetum coccineum]